MISARKYGSLTVWMAILALAIVACGENAQESRANGTCLTKIRGGSSKILPLNSGMTCNEIAQTIVLLSNAPGSYSLSDSRPDHGTLTCRVYPRSMAPQQIKCWQGKKRFKVVAIRRLLDKDPA